MDLFVDELKDIYNAELQVIEALPSLIKGSLSKSLKMALIHHFHETKGQVKRLLRIFGILKLSSEENACGTMEGIILEAQELIKTTHPSAVLDAAIIGFLQKVIHYEIASYGTLHHFAGELQLSFEIHSLLADTLEEEAAADKLLSKIAKGSIFSLDENREAAV